MPSADLMGNRRGCRTGTKGAQRRNKSAVTHGAYKKIFDGRTRDAREIRTIAANWMSDLGGPANLSSMELSILEDLSIIAWRCKRLGRALVHADGDAPETISRDFLRFHSSLVDGLCKLGLKRRAREVQSLQQYLNNSNGGNT